MLFSQRYGYEKIKDIVQKESIDDDLRNKLWNLWFETFGDYMRGSGYYRDEIIGSYKAYWQYYFNNRIDELPYKPERTREYIKEYFFECEWNRIYDFIEFSLSVIKAYSSSFYRTGFNSECINRILERELAAYRVVNNKVVETTSEGEIQLIEETLLNTNNDSFKIIHKHLELAFNSLYNRNNPHFDKAIEESIKATEATYKIILNEKGKLTGGEGAKKLQKEYKDNSIEYDIFEMFKKTYGKYSELIRHGNEKNKNIKFEEAKLMFNMHISLINYLLSNNK